MDNYGGIPYIWKPTNGVDSTGQYQRLPALSNGIKITADGPVRMYFTLSDFQNDTNGVDAINVSGSYQYDAPVHIRGIWVKALSNSAEIELISFSHIGL